MPDGERVVFNAKLDLGGIARQIPAERNPAGN
jgi:hypothetical protein